MGCPPADFGRELAIAGHTPSVLARGSRARGDLQASLLREFVPGEGPRASLAKWTASSDDDLSVPDATITGVAQLEVNGTIFHVETVVKVS